MNLQRYYSGSLGFANGFFSALSGSDFDTFEYSGADGAMAFLASVSYIRLDCQG